MDGEQERLMSKPVHLVYGVENSYCGFIIYFAILRIKNICIQI